MDGYKKIIKSHEMRIKILHLFDKLPDKQMLKLQYFIKHKRILKLKKPKRYTEKIQWYKLFYRDPVMVQCVDKFLVRDYIEKKNLSNILNELYGVYDNFDEINFYELPDRFIIKNTIGSATNIICKDKNKFDIDKAHKKIDAWMEHRKYKFAGREWVYDGIKSKIIIEKLLEDFTQKDNDICDYKFLCFNGKPEYIVYDVDRFSNHKRNIYDLEWNDLHIASDCPCYDKQVEKPKNLDKMIKIAKILCEDFPAVRVDLYNIEGEIYFGELTFFPWSGYVQFTPDSFDFEMGEKFILPEKNCKVV